ncbi:MAG: cysteine--tRNA ligase [Proteobacteria bacterium]|jgi:cysteinyl-tRNA synthetase|nr:cysteine--tRNA ligase [Desulfocapsa sp.]MBU3946158.1 cysteine--tRNA ligase [Pseudomonadota bacterium]MCG2745170.1 cysteine--tRNA ligase [Desulfobacteraceae bacterium]MBU4027781.1 cysteine--tRNA ligase [Pseudomonadota bacterium]MBU4043676.1 cysteine--tRNA ligase [Pseudomonadota bacterium]
MPIQTYNTLSRRKEPLKPLENGQIKLYVCGITSYDLCHIGHARSALAFDMIVRYLRYRGYTVTYIRNFTDIDDKIINRAAEQGTNASALAQRFIDEFYVDMDRLGVDRPTFEPRATEHIQEMIDLITELIDKGLAYPSGSDVYYSVNGFPEYGKLSGRNLDDMQAGARIAINENKTNPMDFVLWKGSKPGEPIWDSPWGPGRPGWHIECSAMSRKYLGDTFDIHGGGKDLIFPHHENEVAQSEGASGKKSVNTWIHHGFVTISDEKMSKSLGNFLTIRDVLKHYHPEVLRFFIFSTHYRNPLDFSETAMADATAGLDRLYECMATIDDLSDAGISEEKTATASPKDSKKLHTIEERFQKAMDDDFNTAMAMGILFDAVKVINKICQQLPVNPSQPDITLLKESGVIIKKLAAIMGLLQEDARKYLQQKKAALLNGLDIGEQKILQLIQERKDARAAKDWARGDTIRDQLLAMGIELKDSSSGTTWEIKRS